MAILITGGAGYIGSICVEEFKRLGHEVIVIDNLQTGNRKAVESDVTFYEGNCGDSALLKTIFSNHPVEAVMHFAADTEVEKSTQDPGRFFHNNLINGITLIDTMLEFNCNKIIFSSTAAIFGEAHYVPVDEKHPLLPVNPYGESKLIFEKVLDWYHRAYGLKFIALRYFNAAGATERLGNAKRNVTLLIPVIIKVLLGQRDKLQIFGNDYPTKDGTCVRDYIHVLDLIQAHVQALEKLDKHPNGKYNLGNGLGFSNLEVVRAVEAISGKRVPYEFASRRPGDPAALVASSDFAHKKLGWKPRYTKLEDIVSSAWEWHRKHPHGFE